MSLISLVQQAQSDHTSTTYATNKAERVKQRINPIIQSNEFIGLTASNPAKAKNELRHACESVFQDDPWFEESRDEQSHIIETVMNAVFGLGPIEQFMHDDRITEIMIMGTCPIYIERDGVIEKTTAKFSSNDQVRSLIDHIIGPIGRRIDELSPAVDARLPEGHRFHAIIPPLALDGPVVTIRKFNQHVITLDEMVLNKTIDSNVQKFLTRMVHRHNNVLVSGGTDSGKTTLLNALSCEIDKHERIITIEDSAELRFFKHLHVVRLEARPVNAEGKGEFTIRSLVANALRMRPDRIVVGECRGAEALDMLQAMNTGHDGSLTTLHANSPDDAIVRLQTIVRFGMELPLDVIEAQIASALDYIIQVQRDASGQRFVKTIARVTSNSDRSCSIHCLYQRNSADEVGTWFHDEIDQAASSASTHFSEQTTSEKAECVC